MFRDISNLTDDHPMLRWGIIRVWLMDVLLMKVAPEIAPVSTTTSPTDSQEPSYSYYTR